MSDNKSPSDIDRIIGQRLRLRRRELKLTQDKLAQLLNLTFQQVQKYEKGVNRIAAGRLYDIAKGLGVPITYFYDGVEDMLENNRQALAEENPDAAAPVMTGEMLELVAAFQAIKDDGLRKSLLAAIKAAAKASEDGA
ncbi:MAG: helix-turn-helix transcriptional regulator [Pseudomonadota bacterium]